MPRGICAAAGCPDPPTYRGRCQRHARQNERQINRAGKSIYNTKRWRLTRRKKLALNPICEWDGCTQLAEDVHHRHGVEADPWSLDGLEALCHSHHSRLTRQGQLAS